MIYQIHPDVKHYRRMHIDADEAENKLGEETEFYLNPRPDSYLNEWAPLELEFIVADGGEEVPDLSTYYGRLYLNDRAYDALHDLLADFGEFLPITYKGSRGYIFNGLVLAEHKDALDESNCRVNRYNEPDRVAFLENKLKGTMLFKTAKDHYKLAYCSDAFKNAVEKAALTGLVFKSDLSIAPPD